MEDRSDASSVSTYFCEDDSDMETSRFNHLDPVSLFNNDSMNVSFSRTEDSSTTHYIPSLNEYEAGDFDVVDGFECADERVPGMYSVPTTVSSLLPTTDLPPVETRTEHVFRISSWVIQSSPVARLGDDEDLDNDSSSTEHAALDYIAKLISLCSEKLNTEQSVLTTGTETSASDLEEACGSIFEVIVKLLECNYITESLMEIVNLIWTGIKTEAEEKESIKTSKAREVMLMVLNCASGNKTRLDSIGMEKLLNHSIFTGGEYFEKVSLCSNFTRTACKEFIILEYVETWINNALQVSLECQTAVVDLDIRVILEVIMEANMERSLFLSPEEESKYAGKAQRVVREIFFARCHTFLRSQGFDFKASTTNPSGEGVMANTFTQDRYALATRASAASQEARYTGTRILSEAERYDVADALFAVANEDSIAFTRINYSPPQLFWNSSHDQVLPSSRGSSQESNPFLTEEVIEYGNTDLGRLSQHSVENQGYISSPSLSPQISLPRLSQSQDSNSQKSASCMFEVENQYILSNQFVASGSSSGSSTQEPAWKRGRFSCSQSSN